MQRMITVMDGLFDAEYFDLESRLIGDTFRIFVGKPARLEQGRKYSAIYALDGNLGFASLLGTQRLLTQGAEVPPSFVIGIGYPGKDLLSSMANRNRDYVPTEPGESETRALGGYCQAGGPLFLRFLCEELKPLLAETYPIDEADSTLVGYSLGGLFAAWTLLIRPAAFSNYVLCSPSIWWRNGQIHEWEEDFAQNHDDLAANVFVSAGGLEVREHLRTHAKAIAARNPAMRDHVNGMIDWNDRHGWPEVAMLAPQFAERLESRQYPGLKIHCQIMPDENHMSAPAAMISRGLRYVFGSWRPDSAGMARMTQFDGT